MPTVVLTYQVFGPINAGKESHLSQGQCDGQVYPHTGSLFSQVSAVKGNLSNTYPTKTFLKITLGVDNARFSKREHLRSSKYMPRKRFRTKVTQELTRTHAHFHCTRTDRMFPIMDKPIPT